jgi:hypothetical protein
MDPSQIVPWLQLAEMIFQMLQQFHILPVNPAQAGAPLKLGETALTATQHQALLQRLLAAHIAASVLAAA